MRKLLLFVWLVFTLIPSQAIAFTRDTLWTQTYGGTQSERAHSVQQTEDGGYILAGFTWSFGAGKSDIYLIKTDSNGDVLWTRTYGGTKKEEANSVQQTNDGGYIVAGYKNGFGPGFNDTYLLKTDHNGEILWERTYGKGTLYSVQQTDDGGYISAGDNYVDNLAYPIEAYLIKTDSNGDILWTQTYAYGTNSLNYADAVEQTNDGGYIIAGKTRSVGIDSYDIYLLKTKSNGDTLWTRTYGGANNDFAHSVHQTNEGGYIIGGYTESFGAGSYDVYLIKTRSTGDTLWTRTYGGAAHDEAYSVQHTNTGGYIVAGLTYSFGAGYDDVYILGLDSIGDTLWTRTYGGALIDRGYSMHLTGDGKYIIAGMTNSFGAGNGDVYLLKIGLRRGGFIDYILNFIRELWRKLIH